jgi:hypothetical protein
MRQPGVGDMTRTLSIAFAVVLLLGCSRHSVTSGQAQPGSPSKTAAALPGTAPWSGHVLQGSNTEALRRYLQTVQEIKPTRFDVEWNPATVAIDRDAALRSLRSVSRDGATFVFAAGEPIVARLQAGSILWVRDLALRKVDTVSTQGGLTTVHTQVVSLNEAMPNADIEFEAQVPVQNFLLSRPEAVAEPAPSSTARSGPAAGGLRPVLYLAGEPPDGPPTPPGATPPQSGSAPTPPGDQPDSDNDQDADDAQEDSFQGNAYTGTLKGMQYSIGYLPGSSGALKVVLESRDADDGGGEGESGNPGEGNEEKAEEAEKEAKEARDQIKQAQQDDWNDEQQIRNLDDDYQKQLSQMQQDDQNRRNPSSTGPTPPQRQTDSNGTPLTEQAMEAKLTQQYDQARSLAVKQLAARREILAQWEAKKQAAEEQLRMLKTAGKAVKELFAIASDNLDIRFKAEAELSGFSTAAALQLVHGDLKQAQIQFKNLNGHVKAAFIGRLGKPGNKGLKIPVMHLPIVFNVPMPVGGLPFVAQLGGDFLVTVFLAGNHATLAVNGEYTFNGSSGFSYSKTTASMTDNSSFSGDKPAVTNYQGASPGVSAVVLGVQLPRIGFGLGITGVASSVAYFDVVHVVTMTQSADAAVGMLAPRCKRITYDATGHVGVETSVLLIPIESIQKWASDKASGKKEVFKLGNQVLDPPVKGCAV